MIRMEVCMDIVGLKRDGYSIRAIARKLGIHRKTVKKYLECREAPQYRRRGTGPSKLDSYKQLIKDYLAQEPYSATWLLDRLRLQGYTGGYELVKQYAREIKGQQMRLAYIRFETEPGRQAQVDWGDFQIQEADGRTTKIYVFVMVLGYSRAKYVEFVERCTLEQFMDCHIRAFKHLGGVPAEVLYDNMKHVVIGRQDGAPVFNSEFLHFARHYGFQPKACPVQSPWVKGKVERPIDYVRNRFWRGYDFKAIPKANQDVCGWLAAVAHERVHGTHHQVVRERWEQEKPHLCALPERDYDTSLKVFRTVYKDCQVSYNANRYIVPHTVVGKTIMLKIKDGIIRFYDDDRLLATYQEPDGKHQVIGDRQFYEQLAKDRAQLSRKYNRSGKGKATRGLSTPSLYPQVQHRPLSEYERYGTGGAPWNS